MARYSVLRVMIFFGFICALWLLGLREENERGWLLGISALGSMVTSFYVLRGPREEFSTKISRHLDKRASRADRVPADEIAEDAEDAEDVKPSPRT